MPGLWDESLYAGSAEFYALGRLPYPQRLASALADRLDLDHRGRLLDLGCGPGSLTLLLAPLFAEVVAIDADADMLRVGSDLADERGLSNVQWIRAWAEELPTGIGRFDVVTLAQSFHWMDQQPVARSIHGLLTSSGCCVHVGATTHEGIADADGLPYPQPPREQITELVRHYLGPHRRAGQRVVVGEPPSGEDAIFESVGFRGPVRIEVHGGDIFIRSEDQVIASVLSLSSAAPHLFGAQLDSFLADVRRLLRNVSPEGVFAEQQRGITLSLWAR